MNFDKFRDNLIQDFRSDSEDNLNTAIKEWQEQEESDREPTDQELYLFLENYDGAEPDLIWWAGNITGKQSMYTQYEQQIQNQDKELRHFIYSGVLHYGNTSCYFSDVVLDVTSFPSIYLLKNIALKEARDVYENAAFQLSYIQEVSREDALNFLKN